MFVRLVSFFEKNNLLQPYQFGIRQYISISHALLDIVTTSYDATNDKKFIGLIIVDLKKAFDTVDHKILLRELQNYGIRGVIGKLITNYLFDRKQYVIVNGNKSNLCRLEVGMPQGSILGPRAGLRRGLMGLQPQAHRPK